MNEPGDALLSDGAVFLLEGMHNVKFDVHPTTPEARKAFFLIHKPAYAYFELFVANLLLFITIFEKPAVVPLKPIIPSMVELSCILFLSGNAYMKVVACGGWKKYKRNGGRLLRLAIVFAALMDCIVSVIVLTHVRPLRVFRPFFVTDCLYASGVRRVSRQLIQSFFVIFDMMLLLLFFIAIFSAMGFYLWSNHGKDPFFSSYEQSFVSLFVLVTTADYPDVMMPAFHRTRVAPLFFISFLLITLYFLLNVFLAIVFNSNSTMEKAKFKKMFMHQRDALRLAFYDGVDPHTHELDFDVFCKMLLPICSDRKKLFITFLSLNKRKNGTLNLEEFSDVYEALKLKWSLDKVLTFGGLRTYVDHAPDSMRPCLVWMQNIAQMAAFEIFFDVLILVNCILLVVLAFNSGANNAVRSTFSYEFAFALIYTFEAFFKLLALGPTLYFSRHWNQFDFVVTLVIIGLMIWEYLEPLASFGAIGLFLRTVRFLRFMKLRQNLRGVLFSMGNLLPGMGRFFFTVVLVYYVFAIIGMSAFDATVVDCTPDVCGSDYNNQTGFYQLNNFDNILFSYNTMFELMVVNNWYVTMAGHVAMTNRFARFYFIIFYLFAVLLACNVVIAFILDSFGNVFPTIRDLKVTDDIEKGDTVSVPMSLAKQIFDHDDADLHFNAATLIYSAVYFLGKADVRSKIFEGDIAQWIEEDNERRRQSRPTPWTAANLEEPTDDSPPSGWLDA